MDGSVSTVYLVDDDKGVRTSLTRLLSTAGHVVRSYASAGDFLGHHDPAVHGCAVIDLSLPDMDGLDVQQSLLSGRINRPVIFVTGFGDIPTSVRAMKAGAVDFLTKPVDASALLAAVAQALDRDLRSRREGELRHSVEARLASLTPREGEVLAHVTAGRLNKQIAAELGTVEKTVKVHRARMMRKMGVRTVADLVRVVASVGSSGPLMAWPGIGPKVNHADMPV
ncbi:response regulator transcription factor [Mesorhizobium sp. L-8-3]|uniref:response regulator transcription factor n=1 Tax=Mesorhizobium sp. L-8-3 TaxID=2744522 RepID=UPI001927B994|nr:response regulator [Mesorhizobium sp. L-8-3]BCH20585.1 DNA-binding response regulator [Mesorhizobium sp. L-8-3]